MLRFQSDLEMSVFLLRHCSPDPQKQPLILAKYSGNVFAIENQISQSSTWRLNEQEVVERLKRLAENEKATREMLEREKICLQVVFDYTRELTAVVGGERENCIVDELTGLQVEEWNEWLPELEPELVTHESMTLFQAEAMDLLIGVLSTALDQTDIWAATRLLSVLCEPVLPALRRYAATEELSLLPALFSYIINARNEASRGSDAVLAKHFRLLLAFEKTVEDIEEILESINQNPEKK